MALAQIVLILGGESVLADRALSKVMEQRADFEKTTLEKIATQSKEHWFEKFYIPTKGIKLAVSIHGILRKFQTIPTNTKEVLFLHLTNVFVDVIRE